MSSPILPEAKESLVHPSLERYNTADAMMDALKDMGVSYLFSNLGSDHPAIIEALAKGKVLNKNLPEVIMCPHEIVALSAAHGHAMVSGQGQGVIVHTDVGTQNLGGTVHNAARSRIPAFIFAGETPYTLEDELPGSRNSAINYFQNVYNQRGILREYMKWDYEVRTGKNVKQIVYRAMQLAHSEPKGPVYVTAAREVLEEEASQSDKWPSKWRAVEKIQLPADAVKEIATAFAHARNPLIITSYLGRNEKAVSELVKFCEALSIPVMEMSMTHMNFPGDHPLHLGYADEELVAQADVIAVLDADVPWQPKQGLKPAEDCKVFYIDADPLKEDIPLWYMFADHYFRADSGEALVQLNAHLSTLSLDDECIRERLARYLAIHEEQRRKWRKSEQRPDQNTITPEWLTACVREAVDDDAIIISEAITNYGTIHRGIPRKKPGTYFCNGGSSLGWNGGAAIGAKLAKPDQMVVSLSGDGSYLFSVPSSVHYVARRYNTPFLTVIYNNQGWNATKMNALRMHPDSVANRDDRFNVNFDQPADLSKIAEAAGGAYAQRVENAEDLQEALRRGVEEVKNGRSAVIDVKMPQISNQTD